MKNIFIYIISIIIAVLVLLTYANDLIASGMRLKYVIIVVSAMFVILLIVMAVAKILNNKINKK